ncbi:MAG TPA: sigma-70 family RNA polymerase sigma factor [Herpetosiphonaceae bacterium]
MTSETVAGYVRSAQRGDIAAFGQVVAAFQDMAYASAYAMVGDQHLAEDVAQEAFIEAYLTLAQLREPAAFPGWFRRIVFKQGDRATRGKRAALVPLDPGLSEPAPEGDPQGAVEQRELRRFVREAIDRLPAHEREVTLLFYISGHPQHEIAAFLGLPVTTVKKRLFDARKRLRARMEQMAYDDLHASRPSRRPQFSQAVQFLISVRTGDLAHLRGLLDSDPALIGTCEEQQLTDIRSYYVPLLGGYTALHRAIAYRQPAIIALLLERGADVAASTKFGETALHLAVSFNQPETARQLLDRGADPDAAVANGMTPLHWAASRGLAELVALLLARGANPALIDRNGRAARDWAAHKGHQTCLDLLNR